MYGNIPQSSGRWPQLCTEDWNLSYVGERENKLDISPGQAMLLTKLHFTSQNDDCEFNAHSSDWFHSQRVFTK